MKLRKGLTPIICNHCGKEVERWKACVCSEEENTFGEWLKEKERYYRKRQPKGKEVMFSDFFWADLYNKHSNQNVGSKSKSWGETMTKSLEKEIQEITGRMQKNVLTEDSIYAALILHTDIRKLLRSWALGCAKGKGFIEVPASANPNDVYLGYKRAQEHFREGIEEASK